MSTRMDVRKAVKELSLDETKNFLRELVKTRQSLIDERNALKNRTRPKKSLTDKKRSDLEKMLGDLSSNLDCLNQISLDQKKEMFSLIETNDLSEEEREEYRSFIFTTENEIAEGVHFIFDKGAESFNEALKDMTTAIEESLKKFDIWNAYLSAVRGIGPAHAGELVAYLDVAKAGYVSAFWKYCGLSVEEGKADARKKGEKISYNPVLKRRMFLISDNLLKQNPDYRKVYIDRKTRTMSSAREWTKSHIHRDAMRYMVKMFVKDLWVTWRKLEGLTVTPTYQEAKLGYVGKHSIAV